MVDERTLIERRAGRETGTSAVAGFSDPTWTQALDVPYDERLSVLGLSQLKILLYIVRYAWGKARESEGRGSRVRAASSLLRQAITVKQAGESPSCVREAVASASLQEKSSRSSPRVCACYWISSAAVRLASRTRPS